MNVNIKSRLFFMSQAAGRHFIAQGARQDHQHRLDAVLPGRHPGAVLHRLQERVMGMTRLLANEWGRHGHQHQRHRARLHGHRQHRAAARRRDRNKAILDRIPAGRWGVPAGPAAAPRCSWPRGL
jgi:2-deoxy-D-gluconate 3-dehydrogenase